MTHHRNQCWSLLCNGCGNGWGDEGVPHFGTTEEADDFARSEGWTLTASRALCPDCTSIEACAITGHSWGRWDTFGPMKRRRSGEIWVGKVRHCSACATVQWDPPLR